jgi:hypothetical protein
MQVPGNLIVSMLLQIVSSFRGFESTIFCSRAFCFASRLIVNLLDIINKYVLFVLEVSMCSEWELRLIRNACKNLTDMHLPEKNCFLKFAKITVPPNLQ